MSNLSSQFESLAQQFVDGIFKVVRDSSVSLLVEDGIVMSKPLKASKKAASTGRMAKRSDADIQKVVTKIVSTLTKAGATGMRTEFLRAKLGVDKNVLARPLAVALKSKLISKKGAKRATTFFVRTVSSAAKKKPAKKALKKSAK